jgi:REP element-mobilizing transposase RayT
MAIDYYAKMESGSIYHLYNRTNNDETAFKQPDNYPYFLGKVAKYLPECLDIWAYCLMPTHYHLLVKVKDGFDSDYIEKQMGVLQMGYTKAINTRHKRHGSLWQQRFRRVLQREDFWQMRTLCYVHHNPIHHSYAGEYDGWQYSSYHDYVSNIESPYPWLVKNPALTWLSEDETKQKEAFIALHEEYKRNFQRRNYENDEMY